MLIVSDYKMSSTFLIKLKRTAVDEHERFVQRMTIMNQTRD